MSPSQVSISITPPKQEWRGHVIKVKVLNFGSAPLHVTTSTLTLHHHCAAIPSELVHVRPESFTLRAHHWITAHITVSGTSSADYGVLFTGHGEHGSSGTVNSGVGEQVLTGDAVSCVPQAIPAVHHAGLPVLPVALAAGLVLAAIAALVVLALRRRRPRARSARHS